MKIDTDRLSSLDKIEKISFIVELLDSLADFAGERSIKTACKFYLFSNLYKSE